MKRQVIIKTEFLWRHRFLVPSVLLILYFLCGWLRIYSPLYMAAPYVICAVFPVWIYLARASAPEQIMRLHRYGSFVFLLIMLLSNSWSVPSDVDLRAWVTPPSYTGKLIEQLDPDRLSSVDIVAGSIIRVQVDSKQDPIFSFNGGRFQAPKDEDFLTFTVPQTSVPRRTDLVAYNLWRRLCHWSLRLVPDKKPTISTKEKAFITTRKTVRFAYKAQDDFGVRHIYVRVKPLVDSQEGTPIDVLLSSPSLKDVQDVSYAELSSLPWAGQDVGVQVFAVDGAGNKGYAKKEIIKLPERYFRNLFARALIEGREKLLRDPSQSVRHETANVMAGIARQQSELQEDMVSVLALRSGAVRLIIDKDKKLVEKITSLLWSVAVRLEEGEVGLRREKLARIYMEMQEALHLAPESTRVKNLLGALNKAGDQYFKEIESERSRIASVLRAYANASFDGDEASSREHFQARLEEIEIELKNEDERALQGPLAMMSALIENLPTTLPELNSVQDRLAGQLSAMHLLVRAQKKLLSITDQWIEKIEVIKTKAKAETENKRKIERSDILKQREAQRDLMMALEQVLKQANLSMPEVKNSRSAMRTAINDFMAGNLIAAHKQQLEALALLENALLILSEKMKRSLTSVAATVGTTR